MPCGKSLNEFVSDPSKFNDFLLDKSYISGFSPSQEDVSVYNAIKSSPEGEYVNLVRWYNHISSFKSEFGSLPGAAKQLDGCCAGAPCGKGDEEEEDDDDVDLFGSDDEEDDAEAERIKAERIAAYNERKEAKSSKKGAVIAKSNIILDVKPWDDETDLVQLEANVRSITMDGLLWGTSKLVAVGYGIKKLQITLVCEDDKVGTDDLEEQILAFEDHIQSVDIVAFNKI